MLDELAAAGLSLSIATAKPERTAVRILEHFGLTERFEYIVGATLTQERRAKHQIITHVLELLGLDGGDDLTPTVMPRVTSRVMMVGDRDHDVHGALQNGLPCVGVTWGYGSVEELLTAGAFALADEPADVVDLVLAHLPC